MQEIKSQKSQPFFISKGKYQVSFVFVSLPFLPLKNLADNRWVWQGLPYPSCSGLCQKQTWRPYPELLPSLFWENSHHKSDSACSVHVSLLCFQHKRFSLLGTLFPLNLQSSFSDIWNHAHFQSDCMPRQEHGLINRTEGTNRRKEPGQGNFSIFLKHVSHSAVVLNSIWQSATLRSCSYKHTEKNQRCLQQEIQYFLISQYLHSPQNFNVKGPKTMNGFYPHITPDNRVAYIFQTEKPN